MGTTWTQLSDKLNLQAKAKGIPLSGQFELTARCNLGCKMCYVCQPANDRKIAGREYPAREWIHLAQQARDEGMLYLLLTGGEVFLRKDFREIYEAASSMGLRTAIYTNATLITSDIAGWLGRIPPSRVEVTLYGASPETYGRVCGHADGYERAVRGINLMLAEGINVRLRTTVIRDNAGDYDKLLEFAEKSGTILKFCTYVSPRRDKGDKGATVPCEVRLPADEVVKYERRASVDYAERIRVLCPDESFTDDRTDEDTSSRGDDHPFKCSAGRSEFWVTWDGRMTPCAEMGEPASFPFEDGFSAAWEKLKGLSSCIPVCAECQQCSYREECFYCPARLKIETGSYDRPAPYICKYTQTRKNAVGNA